MGQFEMVVLEINKMWKGGNSVGALGMTMVAPDESLIWVAIRLRERKWVWGLLWAFSMCDTTCSLFCKMLMFMLWLEDVK